MKKNGSPNKQYHQQVTFERHTRATNPLSRPTLHTFLAHFRRRPHRIFWLFDPLTGHWRQL